MHDQKGASVDFSKLSKLTDLQKEQYSIQQRSVGLFGIETIQGSIHKS